MVYVAKNIIVDVVVVVSEKSIIISTSSNYVI